MDFFQFLWELRRFPTILLISRKNCNKITLKFFLLNRFFRKLVLFFKGKFVYLLDFPISNFGIMSGKINDRGNIWSNTCVFFREFKKCPWTIIFVAFLFIYKNGFFRENETNYMFSTSILLMNFFPPCLFSVFAYLLDINL